MICERETSELEYAKTSKLWTSGTMVVEGRRDFLENLTEEKILEIRLHTTYVTGGNSGGDGTPFKSVERINDLYNAYISGIPPRFHVSEPALLVGGTTNDGKKFMNGDYLRYQACITNLFLQGAFSDQHFIAMEIGSGTGGMAYSFEQCNLDFTYILMDTPEVLQLATAYLAVNSKKRIYIYDKETFTENFIENELKDYSFVLLPNYILSKLDNLPDIHIFINQASFQEMTELQVQTYLDFAQKKVSGFIYSENVDRHPENLEISTSVTSMLNERFRLHPNKDSYPIIERADTFGKKFIGVQLDNEFEFKEFRNM